MPGYRMLSPQIEGQLAELVRGAEHRQRSGDPAAAAQLLEQAIEQVVEVEGALPAWACGRLATIYRSLRRYDDEVRLLERYCNTSAADDAASRFVARLSKARAIAERARRLENGATKTVKEAKGRLGLNGRGTAREAALRTAQLMPKSAGQQLPSAPGARQGAA